MLLCLLSLCLQSPFTPRVETQCQTVYIPPANPQPGIIPLSAMSAQDNCTGIAHDNRKHTLAVSLVPGRVPTPIPFSGQGKWSFSTTAVPVLAVVIDGKVRKVTRMGMVNGRLQKVKRP